MILLIPVQTFGTGERMHLIFIAEIIFATLGVVLMVHQVGGIVVQWTRILITITLGVGGTHTLFLLVAVMQSTGALTNYGSTGKTLDVLIT